MDQSRYSGAAALLGVLSAVGWLGVVLSVIGGAILLGNGGLAAAVLALPWVVSSLGLVALCAVGGAVLDMAAQARRIGDDLAWLRRRAETGDGREPGLRLAAGLIKTHRGRQIVRAGDGSVRVGDRTFANVIEAERFIDDSRVEI